MSTQAEEREAQAKEEQAAGKLTDLYAQVRDLRIETGDSGVWSIGGGLPSFIEQVAISQGGGETFNHRWKVTLSTSTDEGGTTTYTMKIAPGSLWKNDGNGVKELSISPDGTTVTVADDGTWTVTTTTFGSLYVVDNTGGSIGFDCLLVFGTPGQESKQILLRVAELEVFSSGHRLVQRQVGDALTGGASGLQLGPLTYETDGDTKRFVRYMGAWTFDADNDRWTFAKAVKTDGLPYPAAESLPAREMLIRAGGEVYVAYRPDIGPAPTRWLSRKTTTIVGGISYSEPETDADTGALNANDLTLTYFSDTNEVAGDDITLLYTQVEEANEVSHFET